MQTMNRYRSRVGDKPTESASSETVQARSSSCVIWSIAEVILGSTLTGLTAIVGRCSRISRRLPSVIPVWRAQTGDESAVVGVANTLCNTFTTPNKTSSRPSQNHQQRCDQSTSARSCIQSLSVLVSYIDGQGGNFYQRLVSVHSVIRVHASKETPRMSLVAHYGLKSTAIGVPAKDQ